jgi:THAP4-like, heme-binding beta-barrel domain
VRPARPAITAYRDHMTSADERSERGPAERGPAEHVPGDPGTTQPDPAGGGSPEGAPPLHPSLAPLRFLIGRWEGAGVVGYPTIESAQFGQEISFSQNGKPYLIYASRTWLLDSGGRIGRPLAMETGFWRPQEDGQLEVVLAHASGFTEIYLGQVTGTKIEMATDAVVRTATAKEVTAGRRLYGLIGADLGYAYDMAAVGQPLQSHLSAQLKRVA